MSGTSGGEWGEGPRELARDGNPPGEAGAGRGGSPGGEAWPDGVWQGGRWRGGFWQGRFWQGGAGLGGPIRMSPILMAGNWGSGRKLGWRGVVLAVVAGVVLFSVALAVVAASVVGLTVGVVLTLVKRMWRGTPAVSPQEVTWVVREPGGPGESGEGLAGGTILDAEFREVTPGRRVGRGGGPHDRQ